ncbi:MAG: hypothetical protein C4547_08470 [Phycisphaerales bacterium]|nr:MAG: hypothetical protein C4547_08470 [Phycisphaerales bacterium]
MKCKCFTWTSVLALAALIWNVDRVAAAPPLPGAIFTTTEDGAIVNENVRYTAKEEVYLDGGPGPNAPSGAAGLPEGDYYFQVTDPSGKDLLSTDHISCRKIHVNEHGVIDFVYAGTSYEKEKGKWIAVPCQHAQGVDIDHAELGAITVQLFPYDDTPNKGGVYKVWITPVDDYVGESEACNVGENGPCNVNGENWQPGNFHGFIPAKSKTDNYKVKKNGGGGPGGQPSELTVRKFHDRNFNCTWEEGEEEIAGWAVDVTDPLGITNTEYTPGLILTAEPGVYTFQEDTPAGTLQTHSSLDGVNVSCYPAADPVVLVDVADAFGEVHQIVYGNVGLGSIEVCKVYDANGNGVADEGEPGVPGWQMMINGDIQATGPDGCTTFVDLLPGVYTVSEILPNTGGWIATGPTSVDVEIVSTVVGATVVGSVENVVFTNACTSDADFGTKGFWHNKNGLQLVSQADIDAVNALPPYGSPSQYFDDGDEPFDGLFENGDPVAAAKGDWGEEIAPAGTYQAEVSYFLVDSNGNGGIREQLAQQLLAFIFNVQEYGVGAVWDGQQWVGASDIITAATAAWSSPTTDDGQVWSPILDGYNNSDALPIIHASPCEVVYP